MINDEWEDFKKEVKPIKKSGLIKSLARKKTLEIKKVIQSSKSFDEID